MVPQHDVMIWQCDQILLAWLARHPGEGNDTPLHSSCLENPIDGGAWEAAVHGVARSQTRLSDLAAAAARYPFVNNLSSHGWLLFRSIKVCKMVAFCFLIPYSAMQTMLRGKRKNVVERCCCGHSAGWERISRQSRRKEWVCSEWTAEIMWAPPGRSGRVNALCGLAENFYSLKTKQIPAGRVALCDWWITQGFPGKLHRMNYTGWII